MSEDRNDLLKAVHYFSMEKYVSIFVMIMIVLLIGVNILRVYKDYILVHRSETKGFYDIENNLYNSGTITLLIEEEDEYPMVEIILNGEFIYEFGKNKQATINVTDGDVVQINGSMYTNNIAVSIQSISPNTINYFNNKQILVKQNISTIAIIKM